MTDKLREQVIRTIQDEGDVSPLKTASALPNGNGNGNGDSNGHDVDMATPDPEREPLVQELKLEVDGDLVSPGEAETNPPVPPVFRIADLKREVEAVRDKRKMIRLGPVADGKAGPSSVVLPSVVAFTVFDGGEG